ncbi:hypothetical protein M3O96_06130 [Aquiflexum sp. TKW24L]|uniref:hypothetical protein n=1 Tax=Aquiflexum sp. TKW24L TaxID=2942212 RepID=UPI0020C13A79|nr:hypothetical protein [Aquiflexum sp. TKW24L]MCL6258655.1 hypothetical protein [Aquiflexum sp. TKW24L]
MRFLKTVFFALFLMLSYSSFAQDANKPDLRDGSCTICKGNAQNYSILNVYFSDALGNPNNICEGDGPYFISLLYTSNSKSDIHNFRIIADILKKDRNNPNGDPLDSFYINEYVGSINPCNTGSCIITIPIPDIGIKCQNEFYELSQPLVSWTTSAAKDLEDEYSCQSYPAAQCLNNKNSIPIEVGILSYTFNPIYECFEGDLEQTNVSFIITSLFGGSPTQDYNATWNFTFSDSSSLSSTNFNPTVWNRAVGSSFIATLTISQGVLVGAPVSITVLVPDALSTEDVILSQRVVESSMDATTNEDLASGLIEIEFVEGDYFYFWTSLEDPAFYSEEATIDSLVGGATYKLTTIDNDTGTCRVDLFLLNAKILPVEISGLNAQFINQSRTAKITWATFKEWENSHFEIERSVDGVNNFTLVGEVHGMGWKDTVTEYSFVDKDLPLTGGNILYRLKQVDFNGKHTYSKVISVKVANIQYTKGVWRAYPNPTNGEQLKINLLEKSQYQQELITFRIIHPSFVINPITVESEYAMNEYLAKLLPSIPSGVFVVEVAWGQKVEHIKVMK